MSLILLQLSLCTLTVIHMTSCQQFTLVGGLTNVCSSGQAQQILSVLNLLMTAVSQPRLNGDDSCCKRTEKAVSQLLTTVLQLPQNDSDSSRRTEQMLNQLSTAVSELRQNDVNSSSQINQVLSELMTAVSQSSSRIERVLNHLVISMSRLEQNDASANTGTEQVLDQLSELRQNDVSNSNRVSETLSQLTTIVSRITESGNLTDQLLNELATSVSQLQTGMTQLQTAMSQLVSDATESQTRLLRLQTSVSQQSTAMSQLHSGMTDLQTGVSRLQSDVTELKSAVPGRGLAECPDNFTHVPLANGCYKVVTRELDWYDAGPACQSLHESAHLLVINDAVEQLAVTGIVGSELTRSCTHPWTAGYCGAGASTFVWNVTTNGHNAATAMTYTNWVLGEQLPQRLFFHDDADTDPRDACMYLYSPDDFGWRHHPCTDPDCYICEVEL